MDVESSSSGTLSGIAADRLAINLEISGSYTPVVFSYRTAHSTSSMALVGRAAAYSSLAAHGACAICDWDESDAYLRVVRESTGGLLRCLPGVWDYSSLAHRYYSRLVIRVITRDGFAPPFSTGEGGNQGDAFAALHYQTPSHIITQAMEVDGSITIPLDLPDLTAPLPATVLVYSDDRRFLHPTLAGAVQLAESCRDASRRAGRIVHPDKLEYFMLRLQHGGITLQRAPVPESDGTTSTAPPELVGIPLLPELPKLKSLNKSLNGIRAVRKSAERGPAAPALRLRALHSFGLSVLDYTAGGVLFVQPELRPHQRATDSVYLAAFRLPPWTQRTLLRLPLRLGGLGAPDLTHRSSLQLLTSYLRASWGTNLLAVAASHYILTLPPRGEWEPDGHQLRKALRPLRVIIHTGPKPQLDHARIHTSGDASPLSRLSYAVAATDGSQVDSRLGAGIALWHPDLGIFYRQWFGVQVCAGHSTDAEWLAKIALLPLLTGWQGEVLLVTDSTAALMAGLTRAPQPGSLLVLPLRAALTGTKAHMREAWLPAQHDSGDHSLLAQLNAEADALADRGALAALPYTVPWLPVFAGRVLATHQGCLVLHPPECRRGHHRARRRGPVCADVPPSRQGVELLALHCRVGCSRDHPAGSASEHAAPPAAAPAPPSRLRWGDVPMLPPGVHRYGRPPPPAMPPLLSPPPTAVVAPPAASPRPPAAHPRPQGVHTPRGDRGPYPPAARRPPYWPRRPRRTTSAIPLSSPPQAHRGMACHQR